MHREFFAFVSTLVARLRDSARCDLVGKFRQGICLAANELAIGRARSFESELDARKLRWGPSGSEPLTIFRGGVTAGVFESPTA